MRKIQTFSLLLFTTPLFFLGCTQEQISTLKPKTTPTKTKITLQKLKASSPKNDTLSKHKELTLAQVDNVSKKPLVKVQKLIVNESKEVKVEDFEAKVEIDNDLSMDRLAQEVQNNMEFEVIGKLTFTTPSFEANENWEPYTKKDEVIETAEQFLGVKYIWAANGPSSFDCSGFTRYVFRTVGVELPRYSGHQAKMGDSISFEELEKGDLVFFDTEKKFTGRVNHVGIFIGDNQFIHASSAGKKVMITSFDKKKFYKNKFLEGRRVLDNTENIALGKAKQFIAMN